MQFIGKETQSQYFRGRIVDTAQGKTRIKVDPNLKLVLKIIDYAAQLNDTGYPTESTVTNLIGPRKGRFSLHPWGYAGDERTRDPQRMINWHPKFRAAVSLILTALQSINPAVQHLFEDNAKGGPHLHIEYDEPKIKEYFQKLHASGEAWYLYDKEAK